MADYRFAAQVISRSQGRSVTAAAAYRSASVIADQRTGEIHDYTRKGGVEWTGVMAPDDSPAWVRNREKLWNMVEAKEIRKDAQLAREIQLSLPHELNFEQRKALVRDFVQREFVGRGMVADIAMHQPDRGGDQRNFHVHILLTTREVGPDGFGKKNRTWNSREELTAMRAVWAEVQNAHLRQHLGPDAPQVSHLSYAERGIEKVPTVHLGPVATGMERKGRETFLGDQNRDAARRNQTIRASRDRMAEIDSVASKRTLRSFGYIANEARIAAKKAIDEKRQTETALRNILERKRILGAGTDHASFRKLVLSETKTEIRRLKRRLKFTNGQGKSLRKKARSISRWVTNPARMIWIKIAELHQRDRLEAALRTAEARLQVRLDWLHSGAGKAWIAQKRRAPEWRALRTEERKTRRHVRAAERRVAGAIDLARQAEALSAVSYGRSSIPVGVELAEKAVSSAKYVAETAEKIQSVTQSLPKDLQTKFAQELAKGRGISR